MHCSSCFKQCELLGDTGQHTNFQSILYSFGFVSVTFRNLFILILATLDDLWRDLRSLVIGILPRIRYFLINLFECWKQHPMLGPISGDFLSCSYNQVYTYLRFVIMEEYLCKIYYLSFNKIIMKRYNLIIIYDLIIYISGIIQLIKSPPTIPSVRTRVARAIFLKKLYLCINIYKRTSSKSYNIQFIYTIYVYVCMKK